MTNVSPPPITKDQRRQLLELASLAQSINQKINLYSKISAQSFWTRHIEHSLTLASKPFPKGARVVDWGTGGGMPGLPLAILFPEVEFYLVDAVLKKIRAVESMARRLGLHNVNTWHGRAEEWRGHATHSVSRATAPLATLWAWHERISVNSIRSSPTMWHPSLVCLKGGDLSQEVADLLAAYPRLDVTIAPLEATGEENAFEEKVIVEVNGTYSRSS